ncbi:MAG: hypothetical protein RSG48_05275, partial [Clostridia bacterium]
CNHNFYPFLEGSIKTRKDNNREYVAGWNKSISRNTIVSAEKLKLQNTLNCGIIFKDRSKLNSIIPKGTNFEDVRIIAGRGSKIEIEKVKYLIKLCGG